MTHPRAMSGEELADEVTLLTCPFCGGKASFGTIRYGEKTVQEQGWKQDTFHTVGCISCGARTSTLVGAKTKERAAEMWNGRIDSLSTRTSGMTEERAREVLERVYAEHHAGAELDRCGGFVELEVTLKAILTATSQLSQDNGAEEMRESAAKICDENAQAWATISGPRAAYKYEAAKEIASIIRALPILPAAKGEVTEDEVREAAQEYDLARRNYSHREAMRAALLAARKVRG